MEYVVAKIRDKMRIFEKSGKAVSTFFLTPAEVQEARNVLKNIEYAILGGYDEAERRIIVIGNESANLTDYLSIIRVESFQKGLSHRSILGSVLGLGIKREMIGDIIVNDKICDIIVIREMKEYICNHLQKVGNEKVSTKEISFQEILPIDANKEIKIVSVASLRVDAIISTTYGISREKSNGLVMQEKVLINFVPCSNNSKAIREGDIISVRGYGRLRVIEIVGETRKGRMRLKVEVY